MYITGPLQAISVTFMELSKFQLETKSSMFKTEGKNSKEGK